MTPGAAGPTTARVELVDLTRPLSTGMPVFPGDPEVRLEPVLDVDRDGASVHAVHLGSHTGTHLDAPAHLGRGLTPVDRLPLAQLIGPALVLDARGCPGAAPLPDRLLASVGPGTPIVLIATGWDRHWGTPAAVEHPWLTPEQAAGLLAAGVRTVGVDTLSVDPSSPTAPGGPALAAHRALCPAGVAIAENLTGLDRLLAAQAAGADVEVSLLPLPLQGLDGSPIRAVARVTYPAG